MHICKYLELSPSLPIRWVSYVHLEVQALWNCIHYLCMRTTYQTLILCWHKMLKFIGWSVLVFSADTESFWSSNFWPIENKHKNCIEYGKNKINSTNSSKARKLLNAVSHGGQLHLEQVEPANRTWFPVTQWNWLVHQVPLKNQPVPPGRPRGFALNANL